MNISVALATYNGEKYIIDQINSILQQLNENDEIVISDDGSSDNTVNIIKSYPDERIKLTHNPSKGIISNFENAIKLTKYEIIILSDQDDIWLPNKVDKIRDAFMQGSAELVISAGKYVDSDLNEIYINKTKVTIWHKGIVRNFIKNTYIGCCMAFNRDLLDIILPFPDSIPMHDVWIGILAEISQAKIIYIAEPLILYRRHADTATKEIRRKALQILKWRLALFNQLFLRRCNLGIRR